jgi:N-acyl-phosphatidylethanolamine-hydrolysing phospholipase D
MTPHRPTRASRSRTHPLHSSSRRCSAALLVLLLTACANEPAAVKGRAPHHRDGTFQNNYVEFAPRGLMALLRWKWQAWRDGVPKPPQAPTPTLNVLTDPIFSNRASPMSFLGPARAQKPGLWPHELPRIDLVVISHNHYDHLDADSVKLLAAQSGGPPLFVVPLGLKRWFDGMGITNAIELDWWQSHKVGAVEVVLTPVQHWSGRNLGDRMQTLWGGYALFAPQLHVFFAGDTGYSKDFADIRARFAARQGSASGGGFDIALLPIGAYEPRWFMQEQHVNAEEAVRIHLDLGAKASLGIHWGTFELTDESLDEPPRKLVEARRALNVADSSFFTLAIGQTRRLPPRRLPK